MFEVPLEETLNSNEKPINQKLVAIVILLYIVFAQFFVQYAFPTAPINISTRTTFQPFRRFHTWIQADFDFILHPDKISDNNLKIDASIVRAYLPDDEEMNLTMLVSRNYMKNGQKIYRNTTHEIKPKFVKYQRISDSFHILNKNEVIADEVIVNVSLYGNVMNATGIKIMDDYVDKYAAIYASKVRYCSALVSFYAIGVEFYSIFKNLTFQPNQIIHIVLLLAIVFSGNPLASFFTVFDNKYVDLAFQYIYKSILFFCILTSYDTIQFFRNSERKLFFNIFFLVVSIYLSFMETYFQSSYEYSGPNAISYQPNDAIIFFLLVTHIVVAYIFTVFLRCVSTIMTNITYTIVVISCFAYRTIIYALIIPTICVDKPLLGSSLLYWNDIITGNAYLFINILDRGFTQSFVNLDENKSEQDEIAELEIKMESSGSEE